MKQYKCHKIVQAAIITNIRPEQGGYKRLCLDSGGDKVMPFEWVKKNNPQIGGYFVLYADGYMSYSPWQAFEEGYELLELVDQPVPEPEPAAGETSMADSLARLEKEAAPKPKLAKNKAKKVAKKK